MTDLTPTSVEHRGISRDALQAGNTAIRPHGDAEGRE